MEILRTFFTMKNLRTFLQCKLYVHFSQKITDFFTLFSKKYGLFYNGFLRKKMYALFTLFGKKLRTFYNEKITNFFSINYELF